MTRRIHALDGVRAIAIALVVAHHASVAPGGWLGVHIFFVLSGFLITGILRRTRTSECYWRSFYVKRATRILPPLLVLLVFGALHGDLGFHLDSLGYVFFAANIVQVVHPSVSVMSILWSLAVEEHFYLLWPLAVRTLDRRRLLLLAAGVVLASPVLRAVVTARTHSWMPAYFLTPFQLDGLCLGAMAALLLEDERDRQWLRRFSGPASVAFAALFYGLGFVPGFTRESSGLLFNSVGYSLIVAASVCGVVYLVLRPEGAAARALSLRPIAWIGVVSYGIYLYSGPVMTGALLLAARLHVTHIRVVAVLSVVALVAFSSLSFVFYERPIMRWGHRHA